MHDDDNESEWIYFNGAIYARRHQNIVLFSVFFLSPSLSLFFFYFDCISSLLKRKDSLSAYDNKLTISFNCGTAWAHFLSDVWLKVCNRSPQTSKHLFLHSNLRLFDDNNYKLFVVFSSLHMSCALLSNGMRCHVELMEVLCHFIIAMRRFSYFVFFRWPFLLRTSRVHRVPLTRIIIM